MDGARTDRVMASACALAAGALAAARVGNVADAAHDGGVARVLCLNAQAWRALDVAVGTSLSMVPVGTLATRAALGGALVAAAAGVTLYSVTRRLLGACAETGRLRSVVAAIAAIAAVATVPWQIESAAVGGSSTGALLILLPVALVARACEAGVEKPWAVAALALGAAIGHEPFVGVCALGGCAAFVAASEPSRRSAAGAWRDRKSVLFVAMVSGLAPFLIALARARASGVPLAAALAQAPAGERGASLAGSLAGYARVEIGTVLATLAILGTALALLVPRARPLACALLGVTALGLACAWLGAPLGPTRFGAPALVALASTCALAGVSMQALVRAIAGARVPLSRASAALVVLLELALPVEIADDTLARIQRPASAAAAAWDDAAWGELPPRTVVLVTEPRVYARALAARAGNALRGDLTLVPSYDRGALGRGALASDAALVPLWRDLELVGSPGEASLSSLAALRPLAVAYDPRWGRAIGRHLVPMTLLDRFEPEPRGTSDRRRALDDSASERERLASLLAHDPELAAAAASLLRARALAVASAGDRDLSGRVADDVRAFERER